MAPPSSFIKDHFRAWLVAMRNDLVKEGIWYTIEDGCKTPRDATENLNEKDIRDIENDKVNESDALSLIRQSVPRELAPMIKDEKTAKGAWETLLEMYRTNRQEIDDDYKLDPHGLNNSYGLDDEGRSHDQKNACFSVILTKSAVKPPFLLNFSRYVEWMFPSKNILAKVRFPGKVHGVMFYGSRKQRGLGAGWKTVANTYNLSVGDVLVVEVVKSDDSNLEMNMRVLGSANGVMKSSIDDSDNELIETEGEAEMRRPQVADEDSDETLEDRRGKMTKMSRRRQHMSRINDEDSDEESVEFQKWMGMRNQRQDVADEDSDETLNDLKGRIKMSKRRQRMSSSINVEYSEEELIVPRKLMKMRKQRLDNAYEDSGEKITMSEERQFVSSINFEDSDEESIELQTKMKRRKQRQEIADEASNRTLNDRKGKKKMSVRRQRMSSTNYEDMSEEESAELRKKMKMRKQHYEEDLNETKGMMSRARYSTNVQDEDSNGDFYKPKEKMKRKKRQQGIADVSDEDSEAGFYEWKARMKMKGQQRRQQQNKNVFKEESDEDLNEAKQSKKIWKPQKHTNEESDEDLQEQKRLKKTRKQQKCYTYGIEKESDEDSPGPRGWRKMQGKQNVNEQASVQSKRAKRRKSTTRRDD